MWTGIAQSVERLATGCTVQGSNPGGAKFSAPSRLALGTTQTHIQWLPGHSLGQSGRDVALTTHPI